MPVDANIALNGGQQFDPVAAMAKAASLKNLMGQQQLQGLQIQQAQRENDQAQSLADVYRTALNPDGTLNRQQALTNAAQNGLGAKIPGMQKQWLDTDVAQADLAHKKAQASELDAKTQAQRLSTISSTMAQLASNPNVTHQDVYNTLASLSKSDPNNAPPEMLAQFARNLPGDPAQLRQHLLTIGLNAEQRLKALTPQLQTVNLGGTEKLVDTNTLTNPGATGQVFQKTATPGDILQASTSRANNAANIAKDYAIHGMGPGGTPSPGLDAIVDAIGQYKVAPLTGMALTAPRNQQIMQRVAEKYPDFDATNYGARQKAEKDFGTGAQGNAIRSFAVATDHLNSLDSLVDALGNRDTQGINKIGNLIATQTGSTAPTNFDAAKGIVAKEVVKAIVAGGGGQAEREELAHLLDNAKSPAQLKGVIAQYRDLMDAQRAGLIQQYESATGHTDGATRFAYKPHTGAAPAPSPAPAPAAGGAPPVPVKSDSDYAKLPKGTRFITPDGQTGTKS